MEEWKKYKLGDLGEVIGGATPSTKNISYYDGNIPWITPKDLSNYYDRYISYGERMISEEGFKSCSCKILPKGSVLFSSRAPIGYVAIAANDLCTNQGFKSIIPNTKVIDSEFLYYLLVYNKSRIEAMGSGTTFKEVSGNVMRNVTVFIPNLQSQKSIASILSSLDDKIELNRHINENLEQQAQALFKSWFVDFEPFKDGKFVDSELGMIPEGWKVNNIYEYIDVIYGAPYKSSLFNTDKNGYPLIRIRDLKTYTPQFYTQEILPNTEYIYPGDVIAGMDAEFIPTLWLGEKGLLNQRCCKFISKRKNISNYYILYLLMPELLCVQNYKTGTTVSHLGKADIDRFKVITPPIEIIEKFSTLVNPLYNEKIKLACENRIITNLRDTLLPKLMSGELKLSEIETKLDE